MVKWEWFGAYADVPPSASHGDRIVQSWDTAMTAHDGSDWSACTTWAVRHNEYYLIDIHRARHDFPSLKKKIIDLRGAFAADTVLVEDAGSGIGLIQQLRSEGNLHPISVKPQGSKADRMAAQSALIEAGRMLIPETAPWLDAFRAEMLAFPHGKHDDQVDSLSQFLNWKTSAPAIYVAG